MKRLLLTLLIIVCAFATYAQNQYATTTDGKKVLLKSDGTWEYVKSNTATRGLYGGTNTTRPNSSTAANKPTARSSSTSGNTSTGRKYIRGPRGGCYYINRNGNKTYVDRSFCN